MSEWLNRLDDVLDSALRPRKRSRPQQTGREAPKSDAVGVTETKQEPIQTSRSKGNESNESSSSEDEKFIQHNHRVVTHANRRASSASSSKQQQQQLQAKHNDPALSNASQSSNTTASSSIRGATLPRAAPGRLKRAVRSIPTPPTSKDPGADGDDDNDDDDIKQETVASDVASWRVEQNPSSEAQMTQESSPSNQCNQPTTEKDESSSSEPSLQPLQTSQDITNSMQSLSPDDTHNDSNQSTRAVQESVARRTLMNSRAPTAASTSAALPNESSQDSEKPLADRELLEESKTSLHNGAVNDSDAKANLLYEIPLDSVPSAEAEEQGDVEVEVTPKKDSEQTEHVEKDQMGGESNCTVDRKNGSLENVSSKSGGANGHSETETATKQNGAGVSKTESIGGPDLVNSSSPNSSVDSRSNDSPLYPSKNVCKEGTPSKQLSRKGSFPMSPVAEETNPVVAEKECPPSTPFLPSEGKTYRPSEARSIGVPNTTRETGTGVSRSVSDAEEVSVISDSLMYPQHVVFRSEFEVNRVLTDWEDTSIDIPPYVPSMNCFGVVHVRVLRAQRLPCPVGSSVQAIVSLPPWKGRIRTRKASAFAGSRRRGVCTDWSDDESAISMVHAYSSEESPLPSIKMEVVFSTFGVFAFNICSLTLPCEPLFRAPMMPRRQWFQTLPDGKESIENIPLLQIEAFFEPEEKIVLPSLAAPMEVVEVHRKYSADDSMLESASSVLAPVVASTIQTRQPPLRQHSLSDRSEPLQSVAEFKHALDDTKENKSSVKSPPRSLRPHDTSHFDDKSDLSVSLVSYKKMSSNISTKGHLLRTKTFYTPTWCSICGASIMSGIWKILSFRCEECGIDCCSDCRLQVDVQLPCGSEEARKVVEEAAESHFTTDKLLEWVAPIEQSIHQATHRTINPDSKYLDKELDEGKPEVGIGRLRFNFLRAIVLQNSLPSDADVDFDLPLAALRRGDYYIRVANSDTSKTQRTRTVQRSTKPQFDSIEINVNVPSYSSEFRVELVDAADDHPVGFICMTAQMLLQEQRDDAVRQASIPLPHFSFRKRRVVRELRKYGKYGTANDYFVSDSNKHLGDIVGLIEFHVLLAEDFRALFGSTPYTCPPRPRDDLDLAKFQTHIRRISQVIADVKSTIHTVGYVVSWENPHLTGLSFVVFASFCYFVHPDHFFTGPVFLIIAFMVYLAFLRTRDGLKHRYLDRELLANRKSFVTPEYAALHRPVGLLKVAVMGGKNIRSPEMGLPGNVSCRVHVDLTRFCDDDQRKKLAALDGAAGVSHVLGSTETVYSTSPQWRFLEESEENKRLKHVIPSHGGFFDATAGKQNSSELDFPLLQPFSRHPKSKELELRPWSHSKGALVFEVIFHDFANLIPGSDYSLGEVVIPLAEIAKKGDVCGWYKVSQDMPLDLFPESSQLETEKPTINISIKWLPPIEVEGLPADVEREASIVMQEELVRTVKIAQKKSGGIVGTSLGAINTVRGISGYLLAIQNGLGAMLDSIEAFRHLLNFSDPLKSSLVLTALVFLWFVLYKVPFRLLVFVLGTVPYATSLMARYEKVASRTKKRLESQAKDTKTVAKTSPFPIWVSNFTRSLPVDDDLRKTYFWETKRSLAKKLRHEADERRAIRLRKLWRAKWYETVEILKSDEHNKTSTEFQTSFAVIQGRRFMWWKSEGDFDSGEQPTGRIFLQGHAGLATPSPIEMKNLGEKSSRAVSLFGRGLNDQERITFLVSGEGSKNAFQNAVIAALHTKDD